MREISSYGSNKVSTEYMKQRMDQIRERACPFDLTGGMFFEWWVWMSNEGEMERVSGTGVITLTLVCIEGERYILVDGEAACSEIEVQRQRKAFQERDPEG